MPLCCISFSMCWLKSCIHHGRKCVYWNFISLWKVNIFLLQLDICIFFSSPPDKTETSQNFCLQVVKWFTTGNPVCPLDWLVSDLPLHTHTHTLSVDTQNKLKLLGSTNKKFPVLHCYWYHWMYLGCLWSWKQASCLIESMQTCDSMVFLRHTNSWFAWKKKMVQFPFQKYKTKQKKARNIPSGCITGEI